MPRFSASWPSFLLLVLLGLTGGPARAQRVGLVLSGGEARGLARIGVLKELEANGILIDYIIGTSMGAVIGELYAAGYSPGEIEAIAAARSFKPGPRAGRWKAAFSTTSSPGPRRPPCAWVATSTRWATCT